MVHRKYWNLIVRFGDPETQPILMRLKSDLIELCMAALHGKLNEMNAEWDKRAALGVVLASRGYPASASKGDVISGLDNNLRIPGDEGVSCRDC